MTLPIVPPELQVTTAEEIERHSRMMTQLKVAQVVSNQQIPDRMWTTASKVVERDVEWLWRERIPLGEATMFAGEPGAMKSWLCYDLAARLSVGTHFPQEGLPTPKGKIMIVSGEDNQETTIVPRLRSAGADLSMIEILDVNTSYAFSFTNLKLVEQIVTKEFKLLIIDPVSCFFEGDANTNSMTDVRGALRGVLQLASKFNLALVLVHHLRKQEGKKTHRIAGSGAFVAAPRSVFMVHTDPDRTGIAVLDHVKHNLTGDTPPLEYIRQDVPGMRVGRLVWEHSTEEAVAACEPTKSGKLDITEKWLLDKLKDGRIDSVQLEKDALQMGIPERTLKRARARLKNKNMLDVQKSGDGWSVCLPGTPIEF